jgi:hypothetical protein
MGASLSKNKGTISVGEQVEKLGAGGTKLETSQKYGYHPHAASNLTLK